MVTEYAGQGAMHWAETTGLIVFLVSFFALGATAAIFPAKVAKIHSRLIYQQSVVLRGGREVVLPEHVILLGARDSDEALAMLRRMIEDPARAVPSRVFLTRVVGLGTALVCLVAIAAILFGQQVG